MQWQKPSPQQVWRAINIYQDMAWQGKEPSTMLKSRLEALRAVSNGEFFESKSFERDPNESPPQKYNLRLGNPFYPHMKLVIEPTPDALGYMFRADTHDKHIRPAPGSKEYAMFAELMAHNQKLAEQIESAWEQAGLPTFKQYLRNDLARRAAGAQRVP